MDIPIAVSRLALSSGAFAAPGRAAAVFWALALMPATLPAAPSTFDSVIGNAILCRSHLDNAFFHSYLTEAFGPSYKHEGGAYWFKADGTLWGASVSDVLVSDDSSALTFIGAVSDATPDALGESIRNAAGVRYYKAGSTPFAPLEAGAGSRIVYFNDKSKVFCSKFKQVPNAL